MSEAPEDLRERKWNTKKKQIMEEMLKARRRDTVVAGRGVTRKAVAWPRRSETDDDPLLLTWMVEEVRRDTVVAGRWCHSEASGLASKSRN